MNPTVNQEQEKTFLECYNENVAPKLRDIDIFIKQKPEKISVCDIARLLYISTEEVAEILRTEKIDEVTPHNFFQIMKKGSSDICKIFSRQLSCGLSKTYTPADISYIYNIDIDVVLEACSNIGISTFNYITIKLLFSHIPANFALVP